MNTENDQDLTPSLDQPKSAISFEKLVGFLESEIRAGRELVNASDLLEKIKGGDFAE